MIRYGIYKYMLLKEACRKNVLKKKNIAMKASD